MKNTTRIDREGNREGHGDTGQSGARVKKGQFLQIGTQVGLASETAATSPNRKSGTSSGGEQ